jgi:hypothetical protein
MDRHCATRGLRRLTVHAGVKIARMHPHLLRHTYVTTMLDAEVDLRDVQIAARHADPRTTMRYDRDVAIRLAHDQAVIGDEHQILAPTLLRSQTLSLLYQEVHRGEMAQKDAERRLNYIRGLRIRLLGDRVLQTVAWKVADQLGWPDTMIAEYVALPQLQADALITLDGQLADAVKKLVTVAPIDALS